LPKKNPRRVPLYTDVRLLIIGATAEEHYLFSLPTEAVPAWLDQKFAKSYPEHETEESKDRFTEWRDKEAAKFRQHLELAVRCKCSELIVIFDME